MCVCLFVCLSVCVYVWVKTHVCVCMYVHVFMYVCVCVFYSFTQQYGIHRWSGGTLAEGLLP